MKTENVTVSMKQEKLRATRRYMAKKDVRIEQELSDALEKLYEKYVPAPVREYIDETPVETAPKRSKPKVKAEFKDTTEGVI